MNRPFEPKGSTDMTRSRRRQALTLVTIIAVVVVVAQLGGVGATKGTGVKRATKAVTLQLIPGGSAPSLVSTSLASTSAKAATGQTLRLHTTAKVTSSSKGTTQVVCGIVYSRAKDANWTLGTPTETLTLTRAGATKSVTIDRTILAPATDTYTASSRCHVATPERGAIVKGIGTASIANGLPAGAAKPVK